MTVYNINEVTRQPIVLFSTGIRGLDWLYGDGEGNEGLAEGKISIWSASKGLGKSRTAIEICKSISRQGFPVLYVTCELSPGAFVSEKLKDFTSNNFYVSDSTSQVGLVNEILAYRPRFVVIDSVNVIEEYGSSRNSAKLLIEGGTAKDGQVYVGLRSAAEEVGCHIVLIAQQNADGTTKGGTSLGHWVDTEVLMHRWDKNMFKSIFVMKTDKHRQGIGGREIIWEHKPWGVRWSEEHWNHTYNKSLDKPEVKKKWYHFFRKNK